MALASVCCHLHFVRPFNIKAEKKEPVYSSRVSSSVRIPGCQVLSLPNCSFTNPSTSLLRVCTAPHVSFQYRVRRTVTCEIAVELGGAPASEQKANVGNRIKVTVPLTVYHLLKAPNFKLEGCEGEVKEILGMWKGQPVSANLPYKVQFVTEFDGQELKFFAHLKDDEFEVLE